MHITLLPALLVFPVSPILALPADSESSLTTVDVSTHMSAVLGDVEDPTEEDKAITDQYLFKYPLKNFIEKRNRADPPTLIWQSDGCKVPVKTIVPGIKAAFEPACHRHNFGYKNYKKQDRASRTAKSQIDWLFYQE